MSLLELVKKDKEMRRLFGERELEIIEKQLMGINLSPSEKTRLSRDIRKKLDIISKLSDFKEEFALKKAQEIKYLIEQAKEIILESPYAKKIKRIIVFGSYLENRLRFDSDIDISIEFKEINSKDSGKFKIEMAGKISSKIQISLYNNLPDKIKKEIDNGRIIYENDAN